jgi:hypothetical protein
LDAIYKTNVLEGHSVYDIDFIRGLCRDLSREKDATKVEELMALLRAVMKEDHEEVKFRIRFLTRKYAHFLAESQAAD